MEWIFHGTVHHCPFYKMLTVFFFSSLSLKHGINDRFVQKGGLFEG